MNDGNINQRIEAILGKRGHLYKPSITTLAALSQYMASAYQAYPELSTSMHTSCVSATDCLKVDSNGTITHIPVGRMHDYDKRELNRTLASLQNTYQARTDVL